MCIYETEKKETGRTMGQYRKRESGIMQDSWFYGELIFTFSHCAKKFNFTLLMFTKMRFWFFWFRI